jgi:hypothetical protein
MYKTYIMKKLCLLFIFLSADSFASEVSDVCSGKVAAIEVSDTNVVFKMGNAWHLVGKYDEPGTKEKMTLLLTAQASGKSVDVKFLKSDYICTNQTYSARLYSVSILN